MTISDKLALLEQTKEAQRVKLGLSSDTPFSDYKYFMKPELNAEYLYRNGEKGVWLDPSDLPTMFQDVNGLEPVTKDGDPVALILDKSKGLEQGEEIIVNGDFSDGTAGWYLNYERGDSDFEIIEGVVEVKVIKNYFAGIEYSLPPLDPSKTYVLSFHYLGRGLRVDLRATGPYSNTSRNLPNTSTMQRINVLFKGVAGTPALIFANPGGAGTSGFFSDFSFRELKGSHATQSTAASRPIYRTDGELHWLEFDGVDDTLNVQLPSGTYTEIKASRDGVTHKYPVNVGGTYTLGDLTQTKQSVSGLVLVNRQLTQAEIENVTNLMKVKAGLSL